MKSSLLPLSGYLTGLLATVKANSEDTGDSAKLFAAFRETRGKAEGREGALRLPYKADRKSVV